MKDVSIEFMELVETIGDDTIKGIFGKLDKSMVAKALKTIDPKISEIIFKNLSKKESDEIKRKMSGMVRIEEVETAQKEIIKIINMENTV